MGRKQLDPSTVNPHALAAELRIVLGQMTRRLREHSQTEDYTWSQKSVVIRLERDGPATVTALAAAEGVRSQSMSATVATLEEAGFITRSPNPDDGRQTILWLTPSCREMLRSARAAREDWLFRAIRSNFNQAEQKQLADSVDLLKRLFSI